MRAQSRIEIALLIAMALFFIGAMGLQLDRGLADNGDFTQYMRWITPGPVGMASNWPLPGTPEHAVRFTNYWIPFWNLQWNLVGEIPSTSAFLLWLPGAFLNFVLYSRNVLYLPWISFFPRLLLLTVLVLWFIWVRRRTKHRLLLLLGVGMPLLLMLTSTDYVVYLNTFYREAASLVFLLLFFGSLLALIHRPSMPYLILSCILLLLLSSSKGSAAYWPMLGVPFVFVAWFWGTGVRPRPLVVIASAAALIVILTATAVTITRATYVATNPYDSLFAGVLRFSADPSVHLRDLGLKQALRCVNTSAYAPPGSGCFARYQDRMSYLNTVEVMVAEPLVLPRMLKFALTNSQHLYMGNLGSFASSDPRSQLVPPIAHRRGIDRNPLNAWSRLKQAYFPRGNTLAITLMIFVAWFAFTLRRRTSERELSLVGLLATIACIADITVVTLGDGTVEIVRHIFLANVLIDVAIILFVNTAMIRLLDFIRAKWPARQARAALPVAQWLHSPQASGYAETLFAVLASGVLIYMLSSPAFSAFFYGEDFLWLGALHQAGGNFLRAIFTPLYGVFFRPAGGAWELGTQLLLPLDPTLYHLRNFLFILVDLFLLHRILLRLTVSRLGRATGMAFFAISKAHLVTIGLISTFPVIVSLMHFLICLLFLLRYLQAGRLRDYLLSLAFFILTVLTRDYSLVLVVVIVVLFAFAAASSAAPHLTYRMAALSSAPFIAAVAVYLVLRFLTLGLPPAAGEASYGLALTGEGLYNNAIVFIGNLLNVSVSPYPSIMGVGDLSTLLTTNADVQSTYRLLLLALGTGLLVWTAFWGIRRDRATSFALIWTAVIIAPTFLVSFSQLYYIFESLAGMAVLLAMSIDGSSRMGRALSVVWIGALAVIGLNGIGTNRNASAQWWYGAQAAARRINDQVFAPHKGEAVRSLTIVAPTPELAHNVEWLLLPGTFQSQLVMPRLFLGPQLVEFRTISMPEYLKDDWVFHADSDLVYSLDQSGGAYVFTRLEPPPRTCISFEGTGHDLPDPWRRFTRTAYWRNFDPTYVSDGTESIGVWVEADLLPGFNPHYGGIGLPPPRSGAFTLDLWVDRPQVVRGVYVYGLDYVGNVVYAWVNADAGTTLTGGARNTLEFKQNADGTHGFKWVPKDQNGVPSVLAVFVDVRERRQVRFYVDRYCESAPLP